MPILDVAPSGTYTEYVTVGGPRVATSRTIHDDSTNRLILSDTPSYPYKEIEINDLYNLSDVGVNASTGTSVFQFIASTTYHVTEVIFECDPDNPPTGASGQIDVTINSTSIFDVNPTIDPGEYSSETATLQQVLSSGEQTIISEGDIVRFDIDQVGSSNPGQAYKATIVGY